MAKVWAKTRTTLEMIKWEHSIFALPFALTAMLLAAGGLPRWRTVAWIVVAMVAARSAAMAFNRWADADLDAANPRTQNAGDSGRAAVAGVCAGIHLRGGGGFLVAAAELNRLTLELAPVVLVVLLGYSYMKRVTRWSHLVLGLALGLAPAAAWIAVRGQPGPAHPGADGGGDAMGGRIRCALCVPGLRTRSRRPGCTACRRRMGIAGGVLGGAAMHLAMLGLLVWFGWLFGFCMRPAGWALARSGAAGLRALDGFAARSAAAECSVLHHERRDRDGVFVFVAADLWMRTVKAGMALTRWSRLDWRPRGYGAKGNEQ